MKDLKVIIAAGGDGTRLGDLNPERKPKSLLFFARKPLISYQLELLVKYKLDIFLSFTNKKQIDEFKGYVKNGLIPEYKYSFGLHSPFEHQRDLFRSRDAKEFIKNSDFLFTHGDLVVKEPLFEKMISSYRKKDSSVIIREKAKENDKYQFVLKDSFIVDIEKTENPKWRYGGVFIIKNKDQKNWLKMCEAESFRSQDFFELSLAEGSKIYVADLSQDELVININTPIQFSFAQKYLSKKNSKEIVLK